MKKLSGFITRHRNLLLVLLLAVTLCVSSTANRRRLEEAAQTVSIPTISSMDEAAAVLSASGSSRIDRDAAMMQDIAALQSLCSQEQLDAATRESAAARLQQLVADREAAMALEAALDGSALWPCTVVVSHGSVTIVTDSATVSAADTALALSLAAAHAGADPACVRIITSP